MERRSLSLPELALISGTRAALGAGIGLLLADTMSDERRKSVGWSLLSVGVLTTIPIVIQLALSDGAQRRSPARSGTGHDDLHPDAFS